MRLIPSRLAFAAATLCLLATPPAAHAQFGGFSPSGLSTQNITSAISGNVASVFNARMQVNQQVALNVTGAGLAAGNSRMVLTAVDGSRSVWDMQTGREMRRYAAGAELPENLRSVQPATDLPLGQVRLVVKDGVGLLNDAKGAVAGRLVLAKQGWAVVAENGLFDAEQDGIEAIKWAAKDLSFELEQFGDSHAEPGLLARLTRLPIKVAAPAVGMRGSTRTAAPGAATEADKSAAPAAAAAAPAAAPAETVEIKPAAAAPEPKVVVSKEFGMPPKASFATLKGDTKANTEEFPVAYAVENLGGGIEEIRLFQNGKLVATDTANKKPKLQSGEVKGSFKARLANGPNEFRLVALSADRIESRPVKAKVDYTAPEKKSTLHVLAVGINKYSNTAMNLNYAMEDATAIADFFEKQRRDLFADIVVHKILDEQATKANIEAALAKLADTNPEDMVLVYLAGHGDTFSDTWYFMPHDVKNPDDEKDVKARAIPSASISKMIQEMGAQKVLLLMDACKSGAALTEYKGLDDRKALNKVARGSGIHVIAAAGSEQFAAEVAQLGHGIFTYTLLEGLGGKASRRGQNFVSVRGLTGFIEEELPELSQQHKGVAQVPVVESRGQDFRMAVN